jgi:hypothetical protein
MAALLEDQLLEAAPLRHGETPAPPADALTEKLYGTAAQPFSHAAAAGHSSTGDAIKSAMPDLVKGAGFACKGGNAPLHDSRDIALRAHQATLDLRNEVHRGYSSKADVVKSGFRGDFLNQFGALRTALMTPSIGEQLSQILGMMPGGADALKSFTAGNLGIGSVDLQAASPGDG